MSNLIKKRCPLIATLFCMCVLALGSLLGVQSTPAYAEEPPVLTLHWSSVDGEDLMEPIKIEYTPGATFADALATKRWNIDSEPFAKEGYFDFSVRVPEPLKKYSNINEMEAARLKGDSVLAEGGMDVYYLMFKKIDTVKFSVEPPVCGTETAVPEDGDPGDDQTNPPKVSTSDNVPYHPSSDEYKLPAIWMDSKAEDVYKGTFKGGDEYFVDVWLKADFGYVFELKSNVKVSVENGEFVEVDTQNEDKLIVIAKVKAVHDWSKWAETTAPTCSKKGVETRECKADAEHKETREIDIDPEAHDWDDGKVTTEPTCTEKGVKTYTCKHDKSHTKTEDVEALDHDWDDGKVTTEPTCTEKGVTTYTCKHDKTHTKTEDIDALGHDWGEWVVTKEPTETKKGVETRTCQLCGEKETRSIDKLDPTPDPDPVAITYRNTAGNGNIWTKGSNVTSDFTFKRSTDDSDAISHFLGVLVDGEELDETDYEAEAGSVIVKLAPDYLETLALGKHTIEALFDDVSDGPTANFTVVAKKVTPSSGTTPTSRVSSTTSSAKSSTSSIAGKTATTGDSAPIASLCVLTLLAAAAMISARRNQVRK